MGSTANEHILPKDVVVIVGGGPVGLILARILSTYGIKSLLFERNKSTTEWPKMDLTNARSMELFHRIGIADDLRRHGVNPSIDSDVLMSTGLTKDRILSRWELPSVNKFQERIEKQNDGTQPRQAWQRISQAIFEKFLKAICDEDPMIDLRFGWKVEDVKEEVDRAVTTVTAPDGNSHVFVSTYVAGCDGGSSRVRKSLDIPIEGGPIPMRAILVHFKSTDLTRLHKHGRFWHIFFTQPAGSLGGVIIAQDEIDTWTTHLFQPIDSDEDLTSVPSEEIVARVLGGMHDSYPITIDKVLVRSTWRPVIAVTKTWSGTHGRVHLAGDAAHQNIPTGGYGMNMGIADAFTLGWMLAATLQGYGGADLLKAYQLERKPVAERCVQHSGVHFQVHMQLQELLTANGTDPRTVDEDTPEARELQEKIDRHYQTHDGENKDFGIEMGYIYKSPIIYPDPDREPEWTPSSYNPTTWPGSRPPHLFLNDGTAIFDLFGKEWTLLNFAVKDEECGQGSLMHAAESLRMPVKRVDLVDEALAKKLYERKLVLVRPDLHVAWRADWVESLEEAERVLCVVTGR